MMNKPLLFCALAVSILSIAIGCVSTRDGKSSNTIYFERTLMDDFQVELRLTQANFNFDIVDANGSNIRFFDPDGNKLPYWIQQWNPKVITIIWVRVKKGGTERVIVKPDPAGSASESTGASVFDRADWNSFRRGWLFSGIISGRVAGWEDPLTDYRIDTKGWKTVDVSGKYVGISDHSRWFVRKEIFLGKGAISFSGFTNNAEVWSLISSDEIYEKVAGDERDADGKEKGRFSHSFNVPDDFGRYVLAGRGQILDGTCDLSIASVDSGYGNIYTRKQVVVSAGKTALAGRQYADSIFPGDPRSLPEKTITRGWRAWAGAENFYIAREYGVPTLASPVLSEKQKLTIPVKQFESSFDLSIKLDFETPRSADTLLDISIGTNEFGIAHERAGDSYAGFVNGSRNGIPQVNEGVPVTVDLKKEGDELTLSINEMKIAGSKLEPGTELSKIKSLEIVALNPKIYDIRLTSPSGRSVMVEHNVYFREDFSGMREGAVFYGWKGIENFKAVSDVDRIALVSSGDDKEESLVISDLPFPDDFSIGIVTGLPLGRETKYSLKVKAGTAQFGIRTEKGDYFLSLAGNEKPVSTAQPGKRVELVFSKQGNLYSLSVDGEKPWDNVELSNFLAGRTIGISTINPRLYEIYIESLE